MSLTYFVVVVDNIRTDEFKKSSRKRQGHEDLIISGSIELTCATSPSPQTLVGKCGGGSGLISLDSQHSKCRGRAGSGWWWCWLQASRPLRWTRPMRQPGWFVSFVLLLFAGFLLTLPTGPTLKNLQVSALRKLIQNVGWDIRTCWITLDYCLECCCKNSTTNSSQTWKI